MEARNAAGDLGTKLRMRRAIRDMSLRDVATITGLSLGQLSQIERGVSQPSIDSLQKICMALEMPISWLFENEPAKENEAHLIVRSTARRKLNFEQLKMTKALMTPDHCQEIQLMEIVIQPSGGFDSDVMKRSGAKCATVLEGSLLLDVEGERYTLGPGDSFAVSAAQVNCYWCDGDVPVRILLAITPALY